MKFPIWLDVYGDNSFRGACPKETLEQVTFFNWLKREYPDLASIALHPKNESKRIGKDFRTLEKDKLAGFCKGASDIIIPGCPAFVCELKRQDHTKSAWKDGQLEYLENCKKKGAFVCVALGFKGASAAIEEWL